MVVSVFPEWEPRRYKELPGVTKCYQQFPTHRTLIGFLMFSEDVVPKHQIDCYYLKCSQIDGRKPQVQTTRIHHSLVKYG
jgi:predicted enzyme related to lactoylglutathione lyase